MMGPDKPEANIVKHSRGWMVYVPSRQGWMKPDLEIVSGDNPFGTDGLKKDFKVPEDAVAFTSSEGARKAASPKYAV